MKQVFTKVRSEEVLPEVRASLTEANTPRSADEFLKKLVFPKEPKTRIWPPQIYSPWTWRRHSALTS